MPFNFTVKVTVPSLPVVFVEASLVAPFFSPSLILRLILAPATPPLSLSNAFAVTISSSPWTFRVPLLS